MKKKKKAVINSNLNDADIQTEIASYAKESARIKRVLDAINGNTRTLGNKLVNVVFFIGILALVLLRFVFNITNDILSLELGIIFLSVKMMWMMYMQSKHEHFLFWILHTIEFEQHEILRRLDARNGDSKATDSKKNLKP